MEQEPVVALLGLGLLPEYQGAASQVDVRASCRLSCLIEELGVPLD